MMIMTLNIRQGGGSRIKKLLASFFAHSPDVLVLTEYRANKNSNAIQAALSERGYKHSAAASSQNGLNTVFIASKYPFKPHTFDQELKEQSHRLLVAEFTGFNIAGVYFAQNKKKQILFNFLKSFPETYRFQPTVLIGDFNTGKHYIDETGRTFYCTTDFELLESVGLVDLWRTRNQNEREYSWYSNSGNGFRIDHCFGTPEIDERTQDIFYSHKEREKGATDHSAMLVKLNL